MRKNNNNSSHWMSISDIMTALMVIFMFIAISYIMEAKKKEMEVEKVLDVYEKTKASMREDLTELVEKDLAKWSENIEFDRVNLSIKFVGKDIQFHSNSDRIRTKFLSILADFMPKYLNIIAKEEYMDKIAEVRIEGHANKPKQAQKGRTKSYLKGIDWSQRRARKLLKYTVSSETFSKLDRNTKQRLEFWIVANGYGYGRTVDKEHNYTIVSKKPICKDCSRRVEFRIITTSEQVVNEILNKFE